MGQAMAKCLRGETDYNRNGTPDTEDVQRLFAAYIARLKEKKDKQVLRKILK